MIKDVSCKHDMKSRIAHGKSSTQQEEDCFHQQIGLQFKEETSEVLCLVHNFVWCWNLGTRKVVHKCLETFEMWWWRRIEISWTDHVGNEEVLYGVMEKWNIWQTIKRRKANWLGHILYRNCFLIKMNYWRKNRRINVMGICRRRCKQPLDDLKEVRGHWKLKEEALDGTLWRTLEQTMDQL